MDQHNQQHIHPSKRNQICSSTRRHTTQQQQQQRRRQQPQFPPHSIPTILLFLLLATFQFTSSSSSPNVYHSVRELDKYGNSIQLRNAAECCNRHGTLVIAAIASDEKEGGIVVCTLRPYRPGIKPQKDKESSCIHILASSDTITTTTPSNSNNYNSAKQNSILQAHIASGIQPDSKLLVRLLRSFAKRWWDRYDATPSINILADATRAIKLGFMSYDVSGEISSLGIGAVVEQENEEDDGDGGGNTKMSRPFGVTSLLLGIESSGNSMKIMSVTPNGVQQSWVARSIGRYSTDANLKLQQLWKKGMNVSEVKELCCRIMREVLLDEGEEEGKSTLQAKRSKGDIVCETLSVDGTKSLERFPLFVAAADKN